MHWARVNACRAYLVEVGLTCCLVLSITFHCHYYIWGYMCSTDLFRFRWLNGYNYSSYYYHHQIGGINLTHWYHIFPWLCASDGCYITVCHLLHKHSGTTGILFSLLLCISWWMQMVGYVWLAYRIRLFLHYTISLSSLCRLIWRHWTYKMPVRYICRVCEWDSAYFLSYPMYNIWGCVFSVHSFPLWWLRKYNMSYNMSYHHRQIGSMNHQPLFRVRSWNNGMCCMYLYILFSNYRLIITQYVILYHWAITTLFS